MIKIGIIGCGWIAEKVYLPIILHSNNSCVYAIYDPNKHQLSLIKEKYDIPFVYNSLDDFLDSPIDAVIITSPNNTHSYYSNCSLMAGKHVLCEKPVAFTVLDFKKTLSLANLNKKVFFPGLVNRYRKDVHIFKNKSKNIGKVKDIEAYWKRKCGIPKPGSWITNNNYAGGGALIDIGTHLIDIALMFIDNYEIKSVNSEFGTIRDVNKFKSNWNNNKSNSSFPFDVETYSFGKIKFENSVLNYHVDWCANINEDITYIKLYGENGTAALKTLFGFSNNYLRDNIEISIEPNNGTRENIYFPIENSFNIYAFELLINSFINQINDNNSTMEIKNTINTINIIENLYKAR